jgi:DNA-binding GntR family transcriptional regulator
MRQDIRLIPLFQSIKNSILDLVYLGNVKSEARIHLMSEICKIQSALRMTFERAIRELSAEARIKLIRGIGSFIAKLKPKVTPLQLLDISGDIYEPEGTYSSKVISKRSLREDIWVCHYSWCVCQKVAYAHMIGLGCIYNVGGQFKIIKITPYLITTW